MKKIFVALCMVAFLAACDDSSSASAENNEPTTLSSAEEQGSSSSSSFTSAGSVTLSSSSRHCEECNDEAISSSIEELNGTSSSSSEKVKPQSSSSEKFGKSSSSVIEASSSSVKSESTEKSSSSEKLSETSSSSADEVESSSSVSDVPQSYAEAKVMPSGTYDCSKYSCFTTEYLNQEFLEAGKYGEILDERDGQVYKTVQIGEQVWIAQNLNLETEISWCGGGSDIAEGDCAIYGRLYTWAAAIDSVKLANDVKNPLDCGHGKECGLKDTVQGVCPNGWHLPSKAEWNTLFTAVEGKSTAGKLLKSLSGWNENGNGTDVFGFSALPVGYRKGDGYYVDGDKTLFWSSTEDGNFDAFSMLLSNTVHRANLAELNYNIKGYGFSVRCVKD